MENARYVAPPMKNGIYRLTIGFLMKSAGMQELIAKKLIICYSAAHATELNRGRANTA